MSAFVIPSIFTAIDRMTAPLRQMGASVNTFAQRSEVAIARQNRAFTKLTPAISEAGKQLMSYAGAAAIAAGIIATISFSSDQIIAYEKNLASFRTIVSDLSNTDFAKFKSEIIDVAKKTKTSSVYVVSSFEKIAGLNADFAKTPESLGRISTAAIVLARASGQELGPSAENLVGIMNQFGFAATEADRTINVLAAGQAVGAASIAETSEALKIFGAIAKGSNTTIEQSVGLIEVLAQKGLKGAEAGTALRGSFVRLQKAGIGYQSGQFQINDALEQAKQKFDTLRTAKEKDAFVTKLFGIENLTAGRVLLDNIDTYNQFTKGVTGTSEAQKAAALNTNTLGSVFDQMKAKWTNMITGSSESEKALEGVKSVIRLLTDNMEMIVDVGGKVLLFFAAWKTAIILQTVFTKLYTIAVKGAEAAQWLWNAAMAANPIGLIILGVVALIALIVVIVKKWDEWGAAIAVFLGPLGFIISLVKTFYDDWGLIKKAFQNDGILGGLKAIGRTILDAILAPLQQVLEIAANLTGFEWAKNAAASIGALRNSMYGYDNNPADMGNGVPVDGSNGIMGVFNPKLAQAQMLEQTINKNTTNTQRVAIEVDAKGANASVKSNTGGVPLVLTSTMGFGK